MPQYANVAVVAQTGGNYPDPVSAMSALATWCGTPSASNPCLLKIMPGVYNIGSNYVTTSSYLDIEGAGEDVTTIVGNEGYQQGIISVVPNSEVRRITIQNTGGGADAFAVGGNGKISNVTAISSGANVSNAAVYCNSCILRNVTASADGSAGLYAMGILAQNGTPIISNATASGSNGAWQSAGVYIEDTTSATLENVTASGNGGGAVYGVNGIYIYSGSYNLTDSSVLTNVTALGNTGIAINMYASPITVNIDRSTISGSANSLSNTGGSVYIGSTKLSGGPTANTGTLVCVGTYNGNYQALNSNCQ
jgi:hypothetical protein